MLRFPNLLVIAKLPDVAVIDTGVTDCPWLGLASYATTDAPLFFGRDRAVRNMLRILDQRGIIGVVGASGSGKSSLISAGLAGAGYRLRSIRPGTEPLAELDRFVESLGNGADGERQIVVVDQLEEIFTLTNDEHVRIEFLDRLCDLVDTPPGGDAPPGGARVRGRLVAFALRSDYYGSCAAYPRFAELVARAHILLGTPTEAELRSMVTSPAAQAGIDIPEDLVDEIVDDVFGEPGALPLVSHVLAETFRLSLMSPPPGGPATSRLEWHAYREAGGVRGAIARTAEQAFQNLEPSQQSIARDMLVLLADPGVTSFDTSRRAQVSSLVPIGDLDRRATLDALAAARIIMIDGSNVEIAHEAVFREWPRLRDWLTSDRENIRARNNLRHAAHLWDDDGRDAAALLRGTHLIAARSVVAGEPPASVVDEAMRDFVAASQVAADEELQIVTRRETATRRSNRRLRVLLGAVVALAVVAATAGVIANRQASKASRERDIAESRRLAAASGTLRGDNGDLAALVAAEAYDLNPDDQTVGAMLSAMTARPGLQSYLHDEFAFTTVSLGRHGDLVAADHLELGVGLWDISGPEPRALGGIPLGDVQAVDIEFTGPDLIVVADNGGTVRLFDTLTRSQVWKTQISGEAATTVAVAVDESGAGLIAVGDDIGNVAVVDAATGSQVANLTTDENTISSLAFTNDGSQLSAATLAGSLSTWQTSNWQTANESIDFEAELWSIAYSPTADILAVGTEADLLFIDVATGEQQGLAINAHSGIVHDVAFVDEQTLVTGGEDGRVLFWDMERRELSRPAINGHSAGVLSIAVDAASGQLVTAGEDLRLGVWSLYLANAVATPILADHPDVAGIARSADGLFAMAGRDGRILFARLDRTTGVPAPITVADGPLTAVAITPDGSIVAVAGPDGLVQAFVTSTGEAATPALSAGSRSASIALDPKQRWLAAAQTDGDCTACTLLFDLSEPSREPIRLRPAALTDDEANRPGYAVAFDPTGTFLLTGDNGGHIDQWRLPTGSAEPVSVWQIKLERGVRAVAYSNDGRFAAVGANGGVLVVIDALTGVEAQRLSGHRGRVAGLAFSPDDALLASTGPDEAATRIWRLSSGLPYSTPIQTGSVRVAVPAWSEDGADLVVGTQWGGPMAYHVDPVRLRQALCTLAQRNLTDREYRQYIGSDRPVEMTCPGLMAGADG